MYIYTYKINYYQFEVISSTENCMLNETAEILFPWMIIVKLCDYYHHCNICFEIIITRIEILPYIGYIILIHKSECAKLLCVKESFILKT